MTTINDIYKGLQQQSLEIDCKTIEIIDSKSETKTRYIGPGYIKQVDGDFEFKIFVQESIGHDSTFPPKEWGRKAGTLMSANRYRVKFTDDGGGEWSSTTYSIEINQGDFMRSDVMFVKGKVSTLKQRTRTNKKNVLSINYFGLTEFHFNNIKKSVTSIDDKMQSFHSIPIIKVDTDAYHVAGRLKNSELGLKITFRNSKVTNQTYLQIMESILFITGTDVSPDIVIYNTSQFEHMIIFAPRNKRNRARIGPPLHCHDYALPESNDGLKMMTNYFDWTQTHTNGRFSSLGKIIRSVILSGNILETNCLLLCVAIERVAKLAIGDVEPLTATQINELKVAQQLIKRNVTDLSIKNRLAGAIGSMKTISASDRLNQLLDLRIIRKREIKVWKKTRNTLAHSGTPAEYKRLIRDRGVLITMFYRIIFAIIEYKGQYQDYSILGYPRKHFGHSLK